jgi:predicted ArsR family transcriptional regulator
VFVALADPSRRLILERLAIEGPQSASTLATDMPISRQAVLKHLANLSDADLVGSRRAGREVLFIARPARLRITAEALEQIGNAWSSRLQNLKAAIEAMDEEDL